jgi:hypothetical protein
MSVRFIVVTFVILFVLTEGSVAGGSVELQVRGELSSVLFKFDTEEWFGNVQQVSTGYQQFYVGPTFKLFSSLKIGAGVGLERTETSPWGLRYGVFGRFNQAGWLLSALYENGAVTGSYVKVVGNKEIISHPSLKLGVQYQSNVGFGPRIDITPVKNLSLWGAFLAGDTALVGLNYSF